MAPLTPSSYAYELYYTDKHWNKFRFQIPKSAWQWSHSTTDPTWFFEPLDVIWNCAVSLGQLDLHDFYILILQDNYKEEKLK